MRSSNPIWPSTSVRIGRVNGSHSARRWPRLTWSPSSTFRRRAVLHAMHRSLGAAAIENDDRDVSRHRHQVAVGVSRQVAVADLHLAVEIRLDERLIRKLRRAADVERAHRQLRAGLADRLRRDDADRLAHVDRRAAREIAAVAGAADAVLGLAGQHGADLDFLDAGRIDRRHVLFDDHRARGHDDLAVEVEQRLGRGAAENARAERGHDRAGVDDRAHLDAAGGAAIRDRDDRILRDVDETARQITRISGLQGGVREALAGAVGRVEVFENRKAFLEVRNDRALDDLARGLGHQPAHGRELPHLGRRTARSRMRHHVDRVDRNVAAVLVLPHRRNARHHLLGELVGALRPGVDHLVVLLALGDQAVVVLLLVFLRQSGGLGDEPRLRLRHHHVVLAERNAGLERLSEPDRHDPVAEDDRLLLPAIAVDGVDHVRDFFLRHQLVGDVERNLDVFGQQPAEDQPARSGVENLRYAVAFRVVGPGAALDLGVQRDRLVGQRMLDLAHVGEDHALPGLAVAHQRHIIEPEHDVLARHDDRHGRWRDAGCCWSTSSARAPRAALRATAARARPSGRRRSRR